MAGFHNFGVPEYAKKDTPAIRRPREIQLPDQEKLDEKASKMKAYIYVRKYIDDNWKNGDRFVFT